MIGKSLKRSVSALALAAALILSAPAVRAGDGVDYEKFVGDRSTALVSVKFLLKMSMPGMDAHESEGETAGVMIDPKGIVLCSNTQMGGFITMMQRMMGGEDGGGGGKDVSIVPTDLKVLVGEDTEGVAAKLVARDTDLDLAWVQIKEPGGKKYDFIDIGQNEVPKIGQNLLTVERLAKHFDRVPAFGEVKLAAITKKPRDLFIPSMMSTTYGVPVFTEGGKFVGVFVLQVPEGGDQNNPMAMFEMRDAMGGLILPADEVVKATKRALEGGDSGAKDEAKKNEGKEKKKE